MCLFLYLTRSVCLGLTDLGSEETGSKVVFFDMFGLFMVAYPQWAGSLLNIR